MELLDRLEVRALGIAGRVHRLGIPGLEVDSVLRFSEKKMKKTRRSRSRRGCRALDLGLESSAVVLLVAALRLTIRPGHGRGRILRPLWTLLSAIQVLDLRLRRHSRLLTWACWLLPCR